MHRLLLLLLAAAPGAAETLTLQTAAPHALRHNADLAAARLAIAEAQGRLVQAGRRANPELETELKPNVRGREFSVSVGFMQKLPLTNRLRLEKAVSRAELAAAEAEVREVERQLSAEVRTAAVKFLALQARRALEEKQISNGREIAAIATKTAAAGEGSTLEAGQVDLEVQQLELGRLQTEAELAALAGELRLLLGLPAAEPVVISGELPDAAIPKSTLPDVKARPDYQMAEARAESAKHGVEAARAGKWDDISVGATAEFERADDAPDGLENDAFVGVKVSIPLPLWNKNEGRIQEAAATAQRAEKEVEALALRIRAEAAAARAEMNASATVVTRTAELLPKAAALEERYRKSYAAGQSTLTEVLRVRDRRLSLETSRLSALRDFHLARIRLEASLGR